MLPQHVLLFSVASFFRRCFYFFASTSMNTCINVFSQFGCASAYIKHLSCQFGLHATAVANCGSSALATTAATISLPKVR